MISRTIFAKIINLIRGESWGRELKTVSAITRTRAKQLRKNATDAENHLWYLLRAKRLENYKFKRQYPIGEYIVDFVCIKHRLIIELDGSQHIDAHHYDTQRTIFLNSRGYKVLRFWNNEVFEQTEGVVSNILSCLPSPQPSPANENNTHK